MPTDEEQATGLEKKEHDALIAGVEVCNSIILAMLCGKAIHRAGVEKEERGRG